MTDTMVAFNECSAIVPKDAYFEHAHAIWDAMKMLEELESVGDDMFQAHLWRDVVYLLTRTFPDYSRG